MASHGSIEAATNLSFLANQHKTGPITVRIATDIHPFCLRISLIRSRGSLAGGGDGEALMRRGWFSPSLHISIFDTSLDCVALGEVQTRDGTSRHTL